MENERGTRPVAPPVSPAIPANEKDRPILFRSSDQPFRSAAASEATRAGSDACAFDPVENDGAAEAEINAIFGAKLSDLRRLPRCQRSLALRAAREWRQSALAALRAQRARDRQAQYALWRSRRQAPRAPG
jgi:hypothetical protein